MAFERYQDVILTEDAPQHGLRAGDIGTVVERHVIAGREDGYSIEFFDMTGRTIVVAAFPASALRAPTSDDVPATRLRRTG